MSSINERESRSLKENSMNKCHFTDWEELYNFYRNDDKDDQYVTSQRVFYYLEKPMFDCRIIFRAKENIYKSLVYSHSNHKIFFNGDCKDTFEEAKEETVRLIIEQIELLPKLIIICNKEGE